ncbi:MAG: hypothetical protein ACP5E3_00995 [Bacteroidales bacterium]
MNVTISSKELDSIIERAVKRALEETGAIPKYISRSEMVKRVGRGNYERGVELRFLSIIKKGGKTSKIFCLRKEFEDYESKILLNN